VSRKFLTSIDLSALTSGGIVGPVVITGGKTTLPAASTGSGSLLFTPGSDPTTYIVGDVWWNSTNLKASTTTSSGGVKTFAFTDSTMTGTWNGSVIGLTYGGTNANLTASSGGIVYSTASAMAILAGTATSGKHLQSGSSAAPSWTTSTYSDTYAINSILYASAANTVSGLATANNSILVTNGSGVPSWSTSVPSGITINSTNSAITDDTASAGPMYPVWVTTNTGNLPLKVSSTKLSFAPATGLLTTTALTTTGDVTVGGNLTVNGTLTTINSNTITVNDKVVELASIEAVTGLQATLATGTAQVTLTTGSTKNLIVGQGVTKTSGAGAFGTTPVIASITSDTVFTLSVNHATAGAIVFSADSTPTDSSGDGSGLVAKASVDKTWTWVASTDSWTSNVGINTSTYKLGGTTILSGSTISSAITSSSLTSVGTLTGLTIGGNLTFTGTARQIIGDFDNATLASRTIFTTSTTNGSPGIYAVPNGTSTAASWQAANSSTLTNASKILIATNGTTDVQLVSGINGSGTYLPLSFLTNGTTQLQLTTGGGLVYTQRALNRGVGSTLAVPVGLSEPGTTITMKYSSATPTPTGTGTFGGGAGSLVVSGSSAPYSYTLTVPTRLTATITNVTATAGTITYTAANTFTAGQTVSITGLTSTGAAFNLQNVTIASASGTQFTVTNAATGTYVAGGTATVGHGIPNNLGTFTTGGGATGYWDLIIQMRGSTGLQIEVDTTVDPNTGIATLAWADSAATNTYRYTIIG
jgi:hypothetical protein